MRPRGSAKAVGPLVLAVLLAAAPPCRAARPADADLVARVEGDYAQVEALWARQDYAAALAILEDLVDLPGMDTLDGVRGRILYKIACGHALRGESDAAVAALRAAVRAGFADAGQMRSDPELAPVRADAGFARLLAQVEAAAARWSSPAFTTPYAADLDPDLKVAGLARLWAEAKYGFAHFDQVPDLDWDRLFVETIPEVRATDSTEDYYRVLKRFYARLQDGHTRVEAPGALFRRMYSRPALDTRLIDGRVHVTAVLDDALRARGLHPGLEIVAVDGQPVKEYAEARVAPYCAASTPQGAAVLVYAYYLLCGADGTDVALELRDASGETSRVVVPRSVHRILTAEPFAFRLLPGNVGYVALNGFGSRDQVAAFDSVFAAIEPTDALILDLRRNTGGDSGVGYDILAHLTSEPFPTLRGRAPVYAALDRARGRPQRWDDVPPASYPPGERCYTKPVAVLIGPQTGSAAEDFCACFAAMERGTLIGRPTAGTTGQPLHFPLPGGGSGQICTRDSEGPDGRPFVGIGIPPDVDVHTTAADLRAGRDAELETALRVLRGERAH